MMGLVALYRQTGIGIHVYSLSFSQSLTDSITGIQLSISNFSFVGRSAYPSTTSVPLHFI